MIENLSKPEPLQPHHQRILFDCGDASLNQWLWHQADKNQQSHASRCFVTCNAQQEVIGFYCLSAGAIMRDDAPKSLQRNMPNLLPVLVMGRLGIDKNYQKQGIGSALLRDVFLRTMRVADEIGVVALLVHALSDKAKAFYLEFGFIESPIQPMTLLMPCKTIKMAIRSNIVLSS